MKRFIQGQDRSQSTLFPESLDAYIDEGNAVRVVDAYVDELDLLSIGFERVNPKATGLQAIIRLFCSNCIFMAISTAYNPAVVWKVNPGAMSN